MVFVTFSTKISIGFLFAVILSSDAKALKKSIHDANTEKENVVQRFPINRAQLEGRKGNNGLSNLPFYGGAKNKVLLLNPSGKPTIADRDSVLPGTIKGEGNFEDDVGMEEESSDGSESNNNNNENSHQLDGTVIGTPPENASVAEAKPVGLAIAGPGGVASSKPVGTAIVGPGGLAVAKPVGTAIAGIEGAEALAGFGAASHQQKRGKVNIPASIINEYQDERRAARFRRQFVVNWI